MKKLSLSAIAALVVAGVLASGCGKKNNNTTVAPAPGGVPPPTTLQNCPPGALPGPNGLYTINGQPCNMVGQLPPNYGPGQYPNNNGLPPYMNPQGGAYQYPYQYYGNLPAVYWNGPFAGGQNGGWVNSQYYWNVVWQQYQYYAQQQRYTQYQMYQYQMFYNWYRQSPYCHYTLMYPPSYGNYPMSNYVNGFNAQFGMYINN